MKGQRCEVVSPTYVSKAMHRSRPSMRGKGGEQSMITVALDPWPVGTDASQVAPQWQQLCCRGRPDSWPPECPCPMSRQPACSKGANDICVAVTSGATRSGGHRLIREHSQQQFVCKSAGAFCSCLCTSMYSTLKQPPLVQRWCMYGFIDMWEAGACLR